MTDRNAQELKQAGAIEAAQDPNSTVTAKQAEDEIVAASRNAGVAAFQFDPDATPEQKKAQARAVCSQNPRLLTCADRLTQLIQAIPPELRSRRPKGTAVITDVDDGTGPDEDLPEVGKGGVLDVATDADGKPVADGADPQSSEAPYSRTGWAPQLGWPKDSAMGSESLLDHATWVEGKLPDKFFGGTLGFRNETSLG
jgi:hypothetical protein